MDIGYGFLEVGAGEGEGFGVVVVDFLLGGVNLFCFYI